jgi:hypothetical protein
MATILVARPAGIPYSVGYGRTKTFDIQGGYSWLASCISTYINLQGLTELL